MEHPPPNWEDVPALRVSQDYVVQAVTDDGGLLLSGPPAFAGMSGGPAIELATGRVVGVAVRVIEAEDRKHAVGLSSVVPGVFIESLVPIPKDKLSRR